MCCQSVRWDFICHRVTSPNRNRQSLNRSMPHPAIPPRSPDAAHTHPGLLGRTHLLRADAHHQRRGSGRQGADYQLHSHYQYPNGLGCDCLSGPKRISDRPQRGPESDLLSQPQTQHHPTEMELHHCNESVKLILSCPLFFLLLCCLPVFGQVVYQEITGLPPELVTSQPAGLSLGTDNAHWMFLPNPAPAGIGRIYRSNGTSGASYIASITAVRLEVE